MVSVDKFFIYGGGRWREVDAGTGRIDGWGRAKFLIARGGKLQAARSRPVLAALRALAERKPSAAKEGLPLPHNYPQWHASRERDIRGCEHYQCCHHTNMGSSGTSKSKDKASIAIQCDKIENGTTTRDQKTSIQTNQIILPQDRSTNKRKRDSTSSEDLFHKKVITVATVHSPKKPEPKRRALPNKSPQKVQSRSSTSSEDNQALVTIKKSLRRPGPLKRKRISSSRETSPILASKVSERRHKPSKYLQPKSKKVRRGVSSSDEILPRKTTRQNVSIMISSDESDFNSRPKIFKRSSKDVKNQGLTRTERSSTDESVKHGLKDKRKTYRESSSDKPIRLKTGKKAGKTSKISLGSTDEPIKQALIPRSEPKSQKILENGFHAGSYQQVTSKELLIDERDVEILRLFLQKHYPDEELLRFDTDDEYKKLHFYQINPLVNVERCPRIAKMISADRQQSLVDFASKLGLRSVSDASSVKTQRYKTRRREERSYIDSDTNVDKENIDRPLKSTKKDSNKVLKESLKRNKRNGSDKRGRDNTMDTVELSSESEEVNGLKPEVKKLAKKTKPKAVISMKRPTLKEYSNLEDHAIVSWVSMGGRASSVNGNRLWRELQEQFQRLTGHGRTWHSLRNRYLRYILPRLHALALPPAQQARLRAAAATGEIKNRRKEPRRNSIFKLPPRGASSRRPPAPRGETADDDASGAQTEDRRGKPGVPNQGKERTGSLPSARAPSPRYSDVTRQFAQRHRHSSERSSTTPHNEPTRSHRRISPETKSRRSPRKNSRTKSPSESNRIQSISPRPNKKSRSPSESSKRKSNSTNSPRESRSRKSNRTKSPSESNRRKSNRTKSPSQSNRRRSNRINSPSESSKRNPVRSNSLSDSNRRKSNRINSPSESNRLKSNRHKSPSESSGKSIETKRRKSLSRSLRKPNSRSSSDSSYDRSSSESSESSGSNSSSESDSDKSPSESDELNPNRAKSPSESNRRRSNRINSPSEPNRLNPNRANSPCEPNKRYQNRTKSPSESNRRRSNRINSPSEPNRRNPNRANSPSEPNKRYQNRTNSPSESNRRRSNRINSPSEPNRRNPNRANSPSEPNKRYQNRTNLPSESNRRKSIRKKSPGESSRSDSPRRRSNRHKSPELPKRTLIASTKHKSNNDSSPNRLLRSDRLTEPSPVKRTRRLFNPTAVL